MVKAQDVIKEKPEEEEWKDKSSEGDGKNNPIAELPLENRDEPTIPRSESQNCKKTSSLC